MGFARGIVFASIAAISFAVLPSIAAAEEQSIWTLKPTHIDRSKQTYERLPPRETGNDKRIWVQVSPRIVVLDSTRFASDGKNYRIAGIRAVAPKRLCRRGDGSRWYCGRLAAIHLGNLVRGNTLFCEAVPAAEEVVLANCLSRTRDVAAEIVSHGYGRVDDDSPLLPLQRDAQLKQIGLWNNPACKVNFDRC